MTSRQSRTLGASLRRRRRKLGVPAEKLDDLLIVGPGWVEHIEEGGGAEAPLELIMRWAQALDTTLDVLLIDVDPGEMHPPERLIATDRNGALLFQFQFGKYVASYKLPDANRGQFDRFLKQFRDDMRTGRPSDGIVSTFLWAIETWPHINPSDLWYFLISRLYIDPFNHPAAFSSGKDLAQSWKRTGGWALEKLIATHYNPFLRQHGLYLLTGDVAHKAQLLNALNLGDRLEVRKVDIVVVGILPNGVEEPVGILHVKTSFAERRSADQSLSRALRERGLLSAFVTMDAKAAPSSRPSNKGELGASHLGTGKDTRGVKRREIEEQGIFDGCFSYNQRTQPTPLGQPATARIVVCDFRDPDDALGEHIRSAWARRRGESV